MNEEQQPSAHPQDSAEEWGVLKRVACDYCGARADERCRDTRDGKPRRSHATRRERVR